MTLEERVDKLEKNEKLFFESFHALQLCVGEVLKLLQPYKQPTEESTNNNTSND